MIVAVFKISVFCNWWTLRFFIGKLAMYVKRLLDIVPSTPKISGIVLIVVPHTRCYSIGKSIYLSTFSFVKTFLSMTHVTSIRNMLLVSLFTRTKSGLAMLILVCQWIYWNHIKFCSLHSPNLAQDYVSTSFLIVQNHKHHRDSNELQKWWYCDDWGK